MRRHLTTTANLVLVFCCSTLSAQASTGDESQLHSYQLPARETPANPKLDMGLNSVIQSSDRLSEATRLGFRERDGKIQVVAVTQPGRAREIAAFVSRLEGQHVLHVDVRVQAFIWPDTLEQLAADPRVTFISKPVYLEVRPMAAVDAPKLESTKNVVITEGVQAMNADAWHSMGYRGDGVKVGVIDLAFGGWQSLVGTELPAAGRVSFQAFGGAQLDPEEDHGTSCAEIIFDVVPDLDGLYLALVATLVDQVAASQWMAANGVTVISESIGTVRGPGDGSPYPEIDSFVQDGGLWAVAGGNDRIGHYQATWSDSDQDGRHEFVSGADINYVVDNQGTYAWLPPLKSLSFTVMWNDWDAPTTDLAVHLVYWDGVTSPTIIGTWDDPQTGIPGQLPVESLSSATLLPGYYGYAISLRSGSTNTDLEVFGSHLWSAYNTKYYVPEGSLGPPADVESCIAVGAIDVLSHDLEAYSSKGPTNGPGGSIYGGRTSPDLAAYANVSTSSAGHLEFNGTSAACPHVAGAAALVWSAYPEWTNNQVRSFLESSAVDMGPAGKDNDFGYGRLWLGEPPGGECTYSINPDEADFDVGGGIGTIQVSTQAGCLWSTQNALSWVHITSGQSGVGPGTVGYRVDPNPDEEPRTGTMTVAGEIFTVSQSADCTADYPPDPSFTVAPNPAIAGQYVQFTHVGNLPMSARSPSDNHASPNSAGGGDRQMTIAPQLRKALLLPIGLTAVPTNPQIGQEVVFEITGYGGSVEAHWDFGGAGCAPFSETFVCEPIVFNCLQSTYKYSTAGTKQVTVTAFDPDTGATIGSALVNLTVQSAGTCGGCSYTLSPTSLDFPAAGGNGTFNVATNTGCAWTAEPSQSWITITSGASGTGSGTVNYSVAVNSGVARQGNIDVENRLHTINQAGAGGGGGGGGGGGTDPATQWSWTVKLGGQTVVTSSQPSFTHRFTTAGAYSVELVAGNCFGSASLTQTLQVLPPPPAEDFLVPAAAHTVGLNGTVWMTDLRIFNPCLDTVDVTIEYLPENTNNSNTVIHGLEFLLAPDATRIFDDIVQQIPGIQGDDNQGSLRFIFDGGNGCTPLIVSRTYNDTPEGTFGQYVPAVPVVPLNEERVFLTGMVDNFYYRTNVGLANFGPDNVGNIGITVYDEFGAQLGDTITTWVPGYSTRQIVEVIERAGILTDVNIFSVGIDTNGADLTMYASVVDNFTGDPVYYVPAGTDEVTVWIPGIAHLAGANESQWRSDITFLNETGGAISARVDYVPEVDLGYSPFMIMNIDAGNALYYVDILGVSMLPPETESKGYFVVTSRGDYGVPHMVARTYNLAPDGGTFGQNLKVFAEGDLIHEGESGYVPGVGNSASPDVGFRTNVGILNTNNEDGASVLLRAYYPTGTIHTVMPHLWLPPGGFTQENLTNLFALQGADAVLSIEVEVQSGGPVAAYASEIDNRTQDPILIPAIRSQNQE